MGWPPPRAPSRRAPALQLRPGDFKKRADTQSCYAASTVASGVTEVLLADALNATKASLLEPGWLAQHQPELLALATNSFWEHK